MEGRIMTNGYGASSGTEVARSPRLRSTAAGRQYCITHAFGAPTLTLTLSTTFPASAPRASGYDSEDPLTTNANRPSRGWVSRLPAVSGAAGFVFAASASTACCTGELTARGVPVGAVPAPF